MDLELPTRIRQAVRTASVLAAALTVALAMTANATPMLVGYQGAIFDDQGLPATGPVAIEVRVYDALAGGTDLYSEFHPSVPLVDGAFDIQIGNGQPLGGNFDVQTFEGGQTWLELAVDGDVLTPRQRLVSVPFALRAAVAESLDGAIGSVPHALVADRLSVVPPFVGAPITALHVNTNESGTPSDDGGRIRWDNDFFGSNNDALVIEKTDANNSNPDNGNSGIVFANTGNDGIVEAAMVIMGDGKVGIGTTDPARDLHVVGRMALDVATSAQGATIHNTGSGDALLVTGHGNQYWDAALHVNNPNPNAGISGYFHNSSGNATMHVQNESNGWVMYLQGNGGHFIQGVDHSSNTKFWIDSTGMAHVRALEILGGADLSESFDVRSESGGTIEPGTVVSIDAENPGELVESAGAYDTAVAGIVSGAGGIEPGMLMAQKGNPDADGEHPVALTGRVYAKADTSAGPIRPGDLLTTSERPGHAMRAADRDRADGAILGKAMSGLDVETGLVLVLVNLQ